MSNPISLKMQKGLFDKQLKELIKNVPMAANSLIKNEGRLLVEELVDRTKPQKGRLNERIRRTVLSGFQPSKGGYKSVPMDAYYKVRKGGRPSVKINVVKAAVTAFIKQQQAHIGFFASGWLGSGNPLGAKRGIPTYVKRHKGQGTATIRNTPLSILITVSNKTKFIGFYPGVFTRMYQLMRAALKTRTYRIQKQLEIMKSKGKKYTIPGSGKSQ